MNTLRVGLVGLGMAVQPHAQALLELRDEVEVLACYSPTASRREAFAERYGLPVVADLGAVMANPAIDAVLILTPPASHLDLVRSATAHGKHILLEKPLDLTTARAEEIVALADQAQVKLAIVLQNRFRPASLALAEIIAEGRLGSLISASARLDNWRPQSYYDEPGRGTLARDGGGVLMTQAIHTLDLLLSYTGLPDELAGYAATSPVHHMETEDIATCVMHFANGAMGTISATTCAYPGLPERIELIGSRGTAILIGAELKAHFHDGTTVSAGDPNAGSGAGAQIMGFGHTLHKALITDFATAIRENRSPKITGHAALRAHDLIDAILTSSTERRPIQPRQR